ncbi:hypothetical protein PTE30175_01960 [Pandoraea terrae]|uniref:Transmembrane protein n=1 Tax=Pandoraea terrae TaxID=1537710 RepID=A0A5E4UGZ2_9BURK|nr:hypothetical protein [Pandoraea terrae]VVD99121.1 hypothetical protein PTE30175_01960 [Pandoraea terrae]
MPVDLSQAGPPHPYPASGPRLLPWLGIWVLCCALGAAVVLLAWPSGVPASGAGFWLSIVGAPNALFAVLLGIARAGYETEYLHALYHNQHRQAWLGKRVADAQRPLQVLAAAYYLPLDGEPLAQVVAAGNVLIKSQKPRGGGGNGLVMHTQLPEPIPAAVEEIDTIGSTDTSEAIQAIGDDTAETEPPAPPMPGDGFGDVLSRLFIPLAHTLHRLSRRGAALAPAVRLLSSAPDPDQTRLRQLHAVLAEYSLDALDCDLAPVTTGLMLADAWLDAGETRPLLVIAAEWHDTPPAGSTEGGVALLLDPGKRPLPTDIPVIAALHRPAAAPLDALADGLSTALLWGKSEPAAVACAWISGLGAEHDAALARAFGQASLAVVTDWKAQRHPDRILGHAGAAAGWLSVAAAIESATEGPQLIVNQTQTVESAVLFAYPQPPHED